MLKRRPVSYMTVIRFRLANVLRLNIGSVSHSTAIDQLTGDLEHRTPPHATVIQVLIYTRGMQTFIEV